MTDVLGVPLAATTDIRHEWALRIDSPVSGVPGPHILPAPGGEHDARTKHAWWAANRPAANPVLLRREVVTSRSTWVETS